MQKLSKIRVNLSKFTVQYKIIRKASVRTWAWNQTTQGEKWRRTGHNSLVRARIHEYQESGTTLTLRNESTAFRQQIPSKSNLIDEIGILRQRKELHISTPGDEWQINQDAKWSELAETYIQGKLQRNLVSS